MKHLTSLGQMWPKYLPLATFAYNTCNTPNLSKYRPYELVFSTKPKLLLNLETTPDIKVSGTFKDYYYLLNKRLQYLHKLQQDFKSKILAMINKEGSFFQYNSGDLVYVISPLISQLHIASRKVMIKYVGPVVIHKIIDPQNYLLMTLDGKIQRVLFEINPETIRSDEGNVHNLVQLKQIINAGFKCKL